MNATTPTPAKPKNLEEDGATERDCARLLTHSIARDAGDPSEYPLTDQRGLPRPQDGDNLGDARPDVGAVEATFATIRGSVFEDRDRDGKRDADEPGLSGRTVYLDINGDGYLDADEPVTLTRDDDPKTGGIVEAGSYAFEHVEHGTYEVLTLAEAGWSSTRVVLERVSVNGEGNGGNADSHGGSTSDDGRFEVFESDSSYGDPDDTNQKTDVFVHDWMTSEIKRVSVGINSVVGDGASYRPILSRNGRFVVFGSDASNLVLNDTNGAADLFVVDRTSGSIELVDLPSDFAHPGDFPDGWSISDDGRFLAFSSFASDLVPNDTNNDYDVFVFDRQESVVTLVTRGVDGEPADGFSGVPSISGDGRFVAFSSYAANLVANDTNDVMDVFLFDRQELVTKRISTAQDGTQGDRGSEFSAISADGRFITFSSRAGNLVSNDTINSFDVFVITNPWVSFTNARKVDLFAGQLLDGVDFGLTPDPGEIRGRLFVDFIANGIYDSGEPGRTGATVYLDANNNGRSDPGETATETGEDGSYVFAGLESEREYQVRMDVPAGYTLILPTADQRGQWQVYLPAGGSIGDRDFGLRVAKTGGQSQNATVAGRLFDDTNGNGRQDVNEHGLPRTTVYLDRNDNGVRESDEPQTFTTSDNPSTPAVNEAGYYSFANLGPGDVAVRILTPSRQRQTGPLGNTLRQTAYPVKLATSLMASNPREVAIGDFNGDEWPDLAVALYASNQVLLLLNDGQGGFSRESITVDLDADYVGPTAIISGAFNGPGASDLAVANLDSNNVAVLLDFDASKKTFAAVNSVSVGRQPIALTAADVNGDGQTDLVVANEEDNSVSLLLNDGTGTFTASTQTLAVGDEPFAVAAQDFNGDGRVDLAVATYGSQSQAPECGQSSGAGLCSYVTVLQSTDTDLVYERHDYPVGIGAFGVAAGDFNGDNKPDLAVTNFLSNTVSVLLNDGEGGFVAGETLAAAAGPMDIVCADADSDSDLDLIVASGTSQQVAIYRNLHSQGRTGFAPAQNYGVFQGLTAIRLSATAGDLNGDGVVDLAVANGTDDVLQVLLNSVVPGAQRAALDGVHAVAGLDFGLQAVNTPPALDAIPNPPVAWEDDAMQTVSLSGITAGAGESQPLSVTASSDNPALLASLNVLYQTPAATASLQWTPAPDQSGRAVITVNVTDGGLDGDLATATDNGVAVRSFTVTVNPVNDLPTLDPLPALLVIDPQAPVQTVLLKGITTGGGESPPLWVSATTNNPQWIQNLAVTYSGSGAEASLSFTTSGPVGSGEVTVTVTDGGLDNNLKTAGDNLSFWQKMAVVASNAPPSVTLSDTMASMPEDVDTTARRKIANVKITDDGIGGQTLGLAGADAASFEIVGAALYLRAGVALDFETKQQFSVAVTVDDPTVGSTPDGSATLTLTLIDKNEPPRVALANLVTTLAENSDTSSRRKVADVVLTDDALGTNTLSLVGADADRFEIVGAGLYLRAGLALDFETQSRLQVTVAVDDPTLGDGPDEAATFSLLVSDVNETPTDLLLLNNRIQETTDTTAGPAPIGRLVVLDPDRGPESYVFSLVPGDGANDNARFLIEDGTLKLQQGQPLSAARQLTYAVRVRVTDGDHTLERAFVVFVTTQNAEPTEITLSPHSVREDADTGRGPVTVGALLAADDTSPSALTYSFGAGPGDDDNGAFLIDGALLKVRQGVALDYESQNALRVRVEVFDGMHRFAAPLVVSVANINEPPMAHSGGPYDMTERGFLTLDASSSSDPDGDMLDYHWDLDTDGEFDDAAGAKPVLTWAALEQLGIVDVGQYTVAVLVDDGKGETVRAATTLTIRAAPLSFDFGTKSSPIKTDYLRVSERTKYTAALGYGWTAGKITSADRKTGTSLDRDLNLTANGTFVVDVPNGTYQVHSRLGDAGKYAHDQMGLSLQGVPLDPVSTPAGQLVWQSYTVKVTNGQLRVGLTDRGGTDKNVAIAGLTVVPWSPDETAPTATISVAAQSPAPAVLWNVVFSEPVGGFSADDLQLSWTGPGQLTKAAATGAGTAYQVSVSGMTGNGKLGAAINAGAAVDLSANPSLASSSVAVDYRYQRQFDFGSATSPVETGYQRVTNKSKYTSAQGYGWTAGSVTSADRKTGSSLDRDVNLTRNGTFVVDVPNGAYDVTLRVGDLGTTAHDQMAISLGGRNVTKLTRVATLDTTAGQVLEKTYPVTINDGRLTVRLQDLDGRDKNVAITALTLTQVTVPVAAPAGAEGESPLDNSEAGQNAVLAADVNGDGSVTAFDALLVVNHLNAHPAGSPAAMASAGSPLNLDVTGDGMVTAQDAVLVLNYLNKQPRTEPQDQGDTPLVDASVLADVRAATRAADNTEPVAQVSVSAPATSVGVLGVVEDSVVPGASRPLAMAPAHKCLEQRRAAPAEVDAAFTKLEDVLTEIAANALQGWDADCVSSCLA